MFRSCDRCDNPATVHLTEIKGGSKTERHLCESCARALHVPQASKELQKLLKSFEPAQSLAQLATKELTRACPECGITWAEFRQHGRFGCARDYEIFGEEIERLLKRIHGSSTYSGKMPGGGSVEAGQRLDSLARARKALQDAIEAENYEEAARLRDEIRKLNEGVGGGDGGGEPGTAPERGAGADAGEPRRADGGG